MKNIRALLIEWEPHTGKRAGNINPKDPNLQCYGWQNIDAIPAIELRLVEDKRNLSEYKNINGITILDGKAEINTAIDNNFPSKMLIEDELIYTEHVKEQIGNKKIKINDLPDDRNKRLKKFKNEYGIKGIKEINPLKV